MKMAEKKMTQRDYYNEVIALAEEAGRQDIVEFAKGRIAQLEKKTGTKKPTANQEENEAIKAELRKVLTTEGATVTDILTRSPLFEKVTNQRMSAILRQMKLAGEVDKYTEKKKTYFFLVA